MNRKIIIAGIGAIVVALIGVFAYRAWQAPGTGQRALQAVLHPLGGRTKPDWQAWISTVAGDGAAAESRFSDPFGLAVDANGAVFVADGGDSNRIKRIGADGAVTTIAGGREGFADGPGAQAAFNTPSALAFDSKGNLYVADTGNHAIRRIAPDGGVSTIAGNGTAGFADGKGDQARFNGPVGLAVDGAGNVFVADTYNDRIRRIAPDGSVTTVAGAGHPGQADGPAGDAAFDTPTAIAVARDGTLYVADTGNNAIRKIGKDGTVSTFAAAPEEERRPILRRPVGLALTRDGYLYVAASSGGRILQLAQDGTYHALRHADAALASEYGSDGAVRLYGPRGLALQHDGSLLVADALALRIQRLGAARPDKMPATQAAPPEPARTEPMPWPLAPQFGKHEVVGLMGEVRGSYDGENRDHFHAGLDVRADVGQPVLAVAPSKVTDPLANWGFGTLSEGIGVGALSYVHMRVGRDTRGRALDPRFDVQRDERGKAQRVRVRRGTRFAVGDVLGTVNGMAHVHLEYYPGGPHGNPLALPFVGISDSIAPHIDSVTLYDSGNHPLRARRGKRLLVPRSAGALQIVVDAYDQMDDNLARRRLGLYRLGYQLLDAEGKPLAGFEQPLITQVYNRLPRNREAVKLLYAPQSGITVYGSKLTRFAYAITNTLRDGQVAPGSWKTDALAPGDYVLRIFAADFAGHSATAGRDLALTIE
ncbi:gluconolaconase [Massilia agilis]|uniref:Gluconolaconase n=1 Tax=Massilia agilis TaxID=1811226 RepID=A0ABT2D8G5_9BURK|nr:gluconolaconase [Massilia agilis]MCS0806733.1 gluconolaconase [Massilia agilis]